MRRTGTVYFFIFGLLAAGCAGELEDMSSGLPDPNAAPKQMFESSVQPIMRQVCQVCHQGGPTAPGPPFMTPMPDVYSTIKVWPMLIGTSPQASKLYMKGMHEGPAFTPTQATIVAFWINAEASAHHGNGDGGPGMPVLPPFAPQPGPNSIELGALGPGLAGAKLQFDATISGAGLQMAALQIVAPATTGVHVVHPLFTVYPQGGTPKPDPVDSFSGLDSTIPMGGHGQLGPGTLILTNFHLGDQLGVVFQAIAATMPPGGGDGGTGGPGGGCKDVGSFTANAKPQLGGICITCHGGQNPGALSALDMSRVNDTSADGQAAACAQVLNKVTPATPAQSRIFQVTVPGSQAVHPFQFPDQNSFNAFQTMVSQWIVREQ